MDEAGVGLGFAAGGHLLARRTAPGRRGRLLRGRLGRGRRCLRGQFVADVVVGEVATPRQQTAGGDEYEGDDGAGGDEYGIDGATTDRSDHSPIARHGLDVGVDVEVGVHVMFVDAADVMGVQAESAVASMIPSLGLVQVFELTVTVERSPARRQGRRSRSGPRTHHHLDGQRPRSLPRTRHHHSRRAWTRR